MKQLSVSKRVLQSPSSATRKYVPLALRAKERGIKVYYLHIGQPDLPTPESILEKFHTVSFPVIKYAPSNGMPETIDAWQSFYRQKGMIFEKNGIIVTSGGAEGLILAFFTIADPGDELLVFEPFYTSYAVIASMGNIVLVPVRTDFVNGYHLPESSDIEKKITEKTRGIIICNPNNPTGTVYGESEIRRISRIAKKHNLFIISDETYQEIVFDGKKAFPFTDCPDIHRQLIIVDSVSKRLNACGLRVGVVVSQNEEVSKGVLKFAQGRLSVATVDQLAVVDMLRHPHPYIEEITKIYQSRRDAVLQSLEKIPEIKPSYPEGAFYMMLKLPIDDSDAFAAFLLNDFHDRGETVMVSPATGFYTTPGLGKNEIRIAYVLEEDKLKRAIELLGLAVRQYNKGNKLT